MFLVGSTIATIALWIAFESLDFKKAWRLSGGALAITTSVFCGVTIVSLSSRFDSNFETNNIVKNLTAGLRVITASQYDEKLLHERIVHLDGEVKPTYEDRDSARVAVQSFLTKYGIEFRNEMPISSPEQEKTKG